MKNRFLSHSSSILVIAITLVAVAIVLPGWVWAQEDDLSSQAATGTAFTYQGRLVYNGTAINGACELVFRLRDAAVGGKQIGLNQRKTNVLMSDGYFNVDLDFGNGIFTGEVRWLEIGIESCPGGTSNVTLKPLIKLNAAPYALGLRPGAVISGTVSNDSSLKVINSSTSGTAYGIYGQSNSSAGYGVYSQGNAHVEGNLTWKPKTSYVSISAAAFQPYRSNTSYDSAGGWFENTSGGSAVFAAPVQLPHGAKITKFTFHWYDISGADGSAMLVRNNLDQTALGLVIANTSGSAGSSSTTQTISSPLTVDNAQYAYHAQVTLPDADVEIHGIVIEYTLNQPY